jgi:hypothetical protein
LTDATVNHWVAQARANNTRRNRLARICTFLRWCVRQGEADPALVEELQSRDNPLRATPPLYGKLQGKYLLPAGLDDNGLAGLNGDGLAWLVDDVATGAGLLG